MRTVRLTHAICFMAFGVFHTLPAAGQSPADPLPTDPWVEIGLTSVSLGERTLRVAIPMGYEGSSRAYPIMVLLDAGDAPQFESAVTTVRFLANRAAIQPLIIVGVMNGGNRSHDMTPVGNAEGREWIPSGGGADAFLEFITDEVLPTVRDRYRTLPYTILAGHSLGGLVGTYAAATRPSAFNAIIAMSPSLQYDGGAVVDDYVRAITTTPVPLRLFTTSGAAEPIIDLNVSRFSDLINSRAHANLIYKHHRYPYSHGITPILSLIDGLMFVFEPISLAGTASDRIPDPFTADSSRLVNAFVATDSTYLYGARTLPARDVGASEALPESYIREEARFAAEDEPGAGVVIALRGVELYPESARAHSTLADMYLTQGDTASARAELARTIEFAEADNDEALVWRASHRLDPGIQVPEEVLQTYVGEFELSPTFTMAVTLVDGGLHGQLTGQQRFAMFAESETMFFLKVVKAQISFTKDDSGTVTGLILHQNGRDRPGLKVR